MNIDVKSKGVRKRSRFSPGCLLHISVIFGCAVGFFVSVNLRIGPSFAEQELRLVMETYFFGDGLARLTGDTSILKNVVTEWQLQRYKDLCNKGLCDGTPPPDVIGYYFNVVKQTDEFAVVELEERPIITDRGEKSSSYLIRCYSLIRDGDDWRVSGGYLNCDGYLPDKYK